MLFSRFSRRRLTATPGQLEIPFDRAGGVLARLRALGLPAHMQLTLTRNRAVMVSVRGPAMRLHEAFESAADEVLRAVVVFATGRGVARRIARRALLAFPIPASASAGARRRERSLPIDRPLIARLELEHRRLNAERFGGRLEAIGLRVSRRMRTRLGHYASRAAPGGPEIVINRRHIARHGWDAAIDTLLHEMVHQWQDEAGLPIDHGPAFRRKAREVGVEPRAKRRVG